MPGYSAPPAAAAAAASADSGSAQSSRERVMAMAAALDRRDPALPTRDPGLMLQTTDWLGYSIMAPLEGRLSDGAGWALLQKAATEDRGCNSAIGALVGLAVGDAVGHPLEFVAVQDDVGAFPGSRPQLTRDLQGSGDSAQLVYKNAFNKFELAPGQWTDDCSMALCLADSLLVHGEYVGGDARLRWFRWFRDGYNNAFRYDDRRYSCGSVGLGGNIASSLEEIHRKYRGSAARDVPVFFGSENEDAGNGSLMRLAPVPIFYWRSPAKAEQIASDQSKATHPGPDAAVCCMFATSLICKAIAAHASGKNPADKPGEFIDQVVEDFLRTHPADSSGMVKLHSLLKCQPPGPTECNWRWRGERMEIQQAIRQRLSSRDGTYNGYPVIPTYWGAYCMDGLAMALWALRSTTTFDDCLFKVVNLLGDADTTGAIACQMAGAIYGFEAILSSRMGAVCVRNLQRWDRCAAVGLRAAMLYHGAPTADAAASHGARAVAAPKGCVHAAQITAADTEIDVGEMCQNCEPGHEKPDRSVCLECCENYCAHHVKSHMMCTGHEMSMNLKSREVYCHVCEKVVPADTTGELKKVVAMLQ
eukprot:TRINITY_DN586_c0_g1_i1.p1 TRINITY_DN586_c0_g1~~TRINITY_DN586_c0_g1_i1.p1  ORF type:complete len:588 (+),score=142.70 TRINITY_DN586_c0_g1_i1:73-1836(+)